MRIVLAFVTGVVAGVIGAVVVIAAEFRGPPDAFDEPAFDHDAYYDGRVQHVTDGDGTRYRYRITHHGHDGTTITTLGDQSQ
jgi:hypothetical protein